MTEWPYMRRLRFTRPIQRPTSLLALAMIVRADDGWIITDEYGRAIAVDVGRDHVHDVTDLIGRESSNPQFDGYLPDPAKPD